MCPLSNREGKPSGSLPANALRCHEAELILALVEMGERNVQLSPIDY